GRRSGWRRQRLPATQIGLKAQSLTVAGQRLTQVSAGLSRLDNVWRANADAEQLSGYIEYQPGGAGGVQAGRVRARLARLVMQRSESDEVTQLLDRQPASVPALDIVVEDLHLRGRALGRLEVLAVNRVAPTREWELTRMNLALPEAQFTATGRWSAAAPSAARAGAATQRQAEYRFQLDITDSGALLRRFGNPDAIRGGRGTVQGDVRWLGSPLQPDFPSTTGQFKIAIEQGQFLHAQTGGAARLLSVLSLQGLVRRLSLDFRDLSQDGFAFDSVTGDVAIARGVASTNNLVMRGAQAAILVEGSADANNETQDLHVFVVPEINLGAASLAYAVVNPIIGLSTFVAQLFLREPLAQANTREFRIVGPWSDPQIEPVAREAGRAPPRIDAPVAASAVPPHSAADEVAR
ncbi:MAG TPA: AsmA-like C-terminal region-containing protein, partial [Burkholderiaceae bacterium]|nr:AsmA-like C-terminal region-containing protein [Burkholderiaceae bacterium]